MGSPAQPLLNLRNRIGQAAQSFSDAHPVDAMRELFGFEPAPVPPDPNKNPYVMEEQREAMDSFRKAQQPKPLHAMTKSLSSK